MNKKDVIPFHLFNHQGKHYVINIEDMCTSAVDNTTAEALEMIAAGSKTLSFDMNEKLKKLGIISVDWRKNQKSAKKGPYPIINLCLFLTQSCNLNCVYCYGDGGGYGTGGNLEEKTAFQAVDWLIEQSGKMKRVHIGFFGGEPFLKFPLMKAIIEYANKRVQEADKEIDYNCTTNATLLDDEQITFIKDHNISVLISIDGPREIHDAQRPFANGKGSYDLILPRIKKMLSVLPDTPGHAVIVGNTDPQTVKDALREIGFTKISVIPASQSLFSKDPDNRQAERDISNLLNVLEQEAETWIRLTQSRDIQALEKLKDRSTLYFGLIALYQHSKIYHACNAGLGMLAVSVSGDVYLCQRFVGMDKYKIGTVFDHDLNKEKYQESPAMSNPLCSACLARYYCAGGCKHDNAGSCGSITTPSEEMCRLRCRELELAASVLCRLDPADQDFLLGGKILIPKPCLLDF